MARGLGGGLLPRPTSPALHTNQEQAGGRERPNLYDWTAPVRRLEPASPQLPQLVKGQPGSLELFSFPPQ